MPIIRNKRTGKVTKIGRKRKTPKPRSKKPLNPRVRKRSIARKV